MKCDLESQDSMKMGKKRSTFEALSSLDIKPTSQRIDIAKIIFHLDIILDAYNKVESK